MNSAFSQEADSRLTLIQDAQYFYQQGWMVGTAGNLSARMPDRSVWITASGRAKGRLTLDDFIHLSSTGAIQTTPPDRQPSAETSIHQAIYGLFPKANACYHVHSIEANLVSRLVDGDEVALPPLEMVKGFGIWAESPHCLLPLFPNHRDVPQIAREIKDRFSQIPPQLPALLIRDHGVTVWAPSLELARNYIELIEYLFRYMVATRQTGIH